MQAKRRDRVTGHVVIESRRDGRVWVAKHTRGDTGKPTRKVLGPAWAKDTGRRTTRGAPVWRAADGAKPADHLTPADARDALDELLAAERAKPATARPQRGVTFGDAIDEWLRYCEHDKADAPSTMRGYRGIAKTHLEKEFGRETPLSRITGLRIDDYRSRLLRGALSRRTAQQIIGLLRGVFTSAKRKGWISTHPMEAVESITVRRSGDFNVLEPEQVEAIARAVASEQAAALMRFAAYSGLRPGELRALRWRDVDFAQSTIHVRRNAPTSAPAASTRTKAPKSGKVRSVPLIAQAVPVLDQLSKREFWTGADDLVFPSPTGTHFDMGKVRDAFYDALDAADLAHLREKDDPIIFYDLRHTFGTLAARVASLADVQAWMGHADIDTTMRYVHHVPRHDAAAKLSEAFRSSSATGVADMPTAPVAP